MRCGERVWSAHSLHSFQTWIGLLSIFSTFHTRKLTTPSWKMPSLNAFIESLTNEPLEKISTQNGSFNSNSNSMSSCVIQWNSLKFEIHIGIKEFSNINWGIGIIKKLLFCSYFWHISLCFYSNLDQDRSLDMELNFASNEYPLGILLMDLSTPITRNTWKCDDDIVITFFSGISSF